MAPNNINFKLLSLNGHGIYSFEKQNTLFGWLMKDKSDICFLQESYSTPEVQKICAPSPMDQNCFALIIAGKVIDLANVTLKLVYNEFCSLKQTPATAKAKILNKIP